MSAYKVATRSTGGRTWWVSYEMAGAAMSDYSDVRDTTAEEAALMEKVVWDNDTHEDRLKLRELIARRSPQDTEAQT